MRSQVSDIENVDGKGKPITPKPATHEAVVDCVVKAVHVVGGARISQFSCTLDRPMPSDPVTIEDKKDWTRDLEIGSATFIATKRGLWISDTELRNCDAACVAEQIKRKAAWPLPLRGYSVKRPDGDGRTQTAGLAATKIKLAGKQVVAWCADVAGRQGVEGHEEHTRCIDARGVLLSEENNSVVKQVRTTTTMTKLPAP